MKQVKKLFTEKEYQEEVKSRRRLAILEETEFDRHHRASSVATGSAGGGSVELTLRSTSGNFIHHIMQPVEAIELLHSLSATVGCHVQLQPRDDFASWREWRVSEAEKQHLNGHPPFCSDLALNKDQGTQNFDQITSEKLKDLNASQEAYAYVNGAAQNTTFDGELDRVETKENIDK